jgi:hypothetical protein
VLAGQFASILLVFAAALIAMMGVTGFRALHAWQARGSVAILAVGVSLFSLELAWQIRLQKIPAKLSWACFGVGFLTGAALLFPWRGAEAFVSRGWPCLLTGSGSRFPAEFCSGCSPGFLSLPALLEARWARIARSSGSHSAAVPLHLS